MGLSRAPKHAGWAPNRLPGHVGPSWTDCGAHHPHPQPLTSFPWWPQEPGQGRRGLVTVLTSSGTEQEMRRVPLGSALYPPPLTSFPALSECLGLLSPISSDLAQPTISSAPQARPRPKGFIIEFSGPPQRQMSYYHSPCTVGDTQPRVTKSSSPRSPCENRGGRNRTRATSHCPEECREGRAAQALPGTGARCREVAGRAGAGLALGTLWE